MNNNINSFAYQLLVLTFVIIFTGGAHADIYKCVNTNAEVYYNDKPCPATAIERKIKAAKDPVGGYIEPDFVPDKETTTLPGAVVGKVANRIIEKTEKESSDSSEQGANQNSSSSTGQSQSSKSENDSAQSSSSSSQSDSGKKASSDSNAVANKLEHLNNVTEIEPSS